jgi:hypothetical protein
MTSSPSEPEQASVLPHSRLPLWAIGLAGGAGFVHALAGEGHFSEWWGYGIFFVTVSVCQVAGAGALLFWSDRRLYWTGIIGTAIVLTVWTLSRTVGIQIGPEGAGPEPVGVLDSISLVLEIGLIWVLARLLRHPEPAPLESEMSPILGHDVEQ